MKKQCKKCNSMCKIEGWSKCWNLCTCKCHKKEYDDNNDLTEKDFWKIENTIPLNGND